MSESVSDRQDLERRLKINNEMTRSGDKSRTICKKRQALAWRGGRRSLSLAPGRCGSVNPPEGIEGVRK